MKIRRVVEEFEAELSAVATGRRLGKAERKTFGDSSTELELKCRGLDLADGARLEVTVDGSVVAEVAVERGRARLELASAEGHSVPPVAAGQTVELRAGGQTIARGTFEPD